MARVERSALLAFQPAQLLALVQDVARYPEFLPGCISASIEPGEGELVRARLGFRIKGLSDSFATENQALIGEDGVHGLRMRLVQGPFRRLSGEWRFLPLGEGASKASLAVDLDFGLRALESLFGSQMEQAVAGVIAAFKARAEALYGRG
ncbi:MAG: SRPBCC family protein [Stagnimonas sp.]|nr:SRPBCC family protein [Stagnimonas sp.]